MQGLIASASKLFRPINRGMASSVPNLVATFPEVKKATHNSNILLIDVREPDELKETGEIPQSINIPLGLVETVFKNFSNEQFKSAYGKDKPYFHTEIMVSCRSGKRSEASQHILQQLGYKKVYNYSGGWLDWEENNRNE